MRDWWMDDDLRPQAEESARQHGYRSLYHACTVLKISTEYAILFRPWEDNEADEMVDNLTLINGHGWKRGHRGMD